MGTEGPTLPKSGLTLGDKELMRQKGEDMMTETEKELSENRNNNLLTLKYSGQLKDSVVFAKGIERVTELKDTTRAKELATKAFHRHPENIENVQVYVLKMKGEKEVYSGTANVRNGDFGSLTEYFLHSGAEDYSTIMEGTDEDRALAAKIFLRVQAAAKLVKQEAAAGNERNQIREEVMQQSDKV